MSDIKGKSKGWEFGCWAVEGPAETVLHLKPVLPQPNGWAWGPLCTRFSQALPVLPPPLPVFPTGPPEKFSAVTLWLGHKCLGPASLIGLALFVQKDEKEDRMSETISGLGVGARPQRRKPSFKICFQTQKRETSHK